MQLRIVPVRLRTAKDFVTDHHRHNRAPLGAVFSVGIAHGDRLVGVAIAGRPVARGYDDGWTIEITRVCVSPEAQKGSCSKLIAACRRAGVRRLRLVIPGYAPIRRLLKAARHFVAQVWTGMALRASGMEGGQVAKEGQTVTRARRLDGSRGAAAAPTTSARPRIAQEKARRQIFLELTSATDCG